ncbi:hypothetical protein DPMN_076265 [Dreissena polymorpha]|uniref:Uncharacterized protein n=1 Tax=Dreissena polymorpha TaxID=45954 RepID=A0A9D4BQC4_DREPO|nr:hypothetical protein DPMN_076265 [Dreissena polymorpha]
MAHVRTWPSDHLDKTSDQFAHLRGFHDDWAKHVTCRKTAPPGSHVIQLTGTIFKLNSHIKETNVLTKFHEHWAKNVSSRVFTCFHYIHIEKNAPPTGGHVFSPIWTIFELVQDINKTNVLTNFHDDWAKIVTSRVFTRKTAPPPGSHETNVLTKFHENWAKNVTSRVENAPPTGGHVFSPIWTIFELVQDINKTNVLTNFHDDWAKIVTSRVFTTKTAPLPPGSHVIRLTRTIFKLNSHIKETNVLTKFHENWAKNVTSRVFTGFHYIHIEKNAPPTGGHVFSPIWTIFELVRDINKTNVLTNFHDDWTKIVTSRVFTRKTAPPIGHVFQRTGTTFELNQHIIKTNILTNFKLDRDFIGTKLLTKFHEDRTINLAPRVFTNKCGRTDNGQRPVTKAQLRNQCGGVGVGTGDGLVVSSNKAHIQLLTKFDKLLTKFADNMLNIQLLTKFGEDRMKTT